MNCTDQTDMRINTLFGIICSNTFSYFLCKRFNFHSPLHFKSFCFRTSSLFIMVTWFLIQQCRVTLIFQGKWFSISFQWMVFYFYIIAVVWWIRYLKGRNFCGKKFLRNLFLRRKAPKTAHFAEFIFANATIEICGIYFCKSNLYP